MQFATSLSLPRAVAQAAGLMLGLAGVWVALQVVTRRRPTGFWRDAAEGLRCRPVAAEDAALLLGLLLALQFPALVAGIFAGEPVPPVPSVPAGPLFLLAPLFLHATLLAVIAWRLRDRRVSWHAAFGGPVPDRDRGVWRDGASWGLATLVPTMLVAWLAALLFHRLGLQIEPQLSLQWMTRPDVTLWRRAYLAFIAVTVAPAAEELLFRGVLLPVLLHRRGPLAAIGLSALLFGLVHVHLAALLPLVCASVCFSLGYLASRNLAVPILMHATFNAVSLLWTVSATPTPG